MGGSGCTTYMTAKEPNTVQRHIGSRMVLTDYIVAFGRPDESLARTMGNNNVVAFLGTTHTYLLVEGGEALLSMTKLDPTRLTLVADNHVVYLQGKRVWGPLDFIYASDEATVTEAEKATFEALGFSRDTPKSVTRRVDIKGAVYPAMDFRGTAFTEMHKARKLSFWAPPTSETQPNLSKFFLRLPAALAMDIAFAPLTVLGLGFIRITGLSEVDPR